MKDFLKKYHQKKIIWNMWIIALSLVMAIWINIFLIDWTDMWLNLKASVLNSQINSNEVKADLFLERNWENISLKNSKSISNLESISMSLTYNPENVSIISINSNIWEIINLWEKNSWIETIIISSNDKKLEEWSELISIKVQKNDDKSEQLNLINANFVDSNQDTYNLSTSWVTF